MNPLTTSAFDLPDRLAAKADPALIAGDERHFAAIAESLEQSIADLSGRLDAERKAPGGIGQTAMDRDMEIHRLTARLRALRRFGLDLCLGRIVSADDPPEPVYVGRLGLSDSAGRRLLLDWRSPAAEPFFGATHANPMGLASRRRYRWTRGRISDYWDEVFTADGLDGHAALDDQSAFIASLGATGRPGCETCSAPSRPTRTPTSAWIPRRSGRRRRSRHRGRPSSPCTAPPTSCTPIPASATAGAASCSSARTSPTWPSSPSCSPASARRECRSAPCGTLSPRSRGQAGDRPGRSPAQVVGGHGDGDRGGRWFYEQPPATGMTVETST